MRGFIYLTDLRLQGKDYGGSCRGAEGTAVPQCSVPHYCFLMTRSEGLQQVSHLALQSVLFLISRMILWVSVRNLGREAAHCFENP